MNLYKFDTTIFDGPSSLAPIVSYFPAYEAFLIARRRRSILPPPLLIDDITSVLISMATDAFDVDPESTTMIYR